MRRRQLRIRRWLVVTFAVVALAFAASASAMPITEGTGGQPPQPVAAPGDGSGGFSWWYVAIGVGAAVGATVCVVGLYRVAGNRRRLAAAH